MYLYLVERTDRTDYEENKAAVVCAHTKDQAENIFLKDKYTPSYVSKVVLKTQTLGVAFENFAEEQVILVDFKAG